MRLFIAGNSHVGALARAQQGRDRAPDSQFQDVQIFPLGRAAFELSAFSRGDDTTVEFLHTDARERFAERSGGLTRFEGADTVWGLCLGLHTVNLVRQPFWASNHPAPVTSPDATPVSEGLCRAIIDAAQRPVMKFLTQLQRAGVPSFVVSSPPLRRDHPASDTCPPAVALAVDRMARQGLEEFLTRNDIEFVDFPPAALADDGFLRDELHRRALSGQSPDRQHANASYGAEMLDRVISHAEKRFC